MSVEPSNGRPWTGCPAAGFGAEALAAELEGMCLVCGGPAEGDLCGNCADDLAEYEAWRSQHYHEGDDL